MKLYLNVHSITNNYVCVTECDSFKLNLIFLMENFTLNDIYVFLKKDKKNIGLLRIEDFLLKSHKKGKFYYINTSNIIKKINLDVFVIEGNQNLNLVKKLSEKSTILKIPNGKNIAIDRYEFLLKLPLVPNDKKEFKDWLHYIKNDSYFKKIDDNENKLQFECFYYFKLIHCNLEERLRLLQCEFTFFLLRLIFSNMNETDFYNISEIIYDKEEIKKEDITNKYLEIFDINYPDKNRPLYYFKRKWSIFLIKGIFPYLKKGYIYLNYADIRWKILPKLQYEYFYKLMINDIRYKNVNLSGKKIIHKKRHLNIEYENTNQKKIRQIGDLKEVNIDFFPPCMKEIFLHLKNTGHLGYQSRFVFSTFLLDIGLNDDVSKEFYSKLDRKIKSSELKNLFDPNKSTYISPGCNNLIIGRSMDTDGTTCKCYFEKKKNNEKFSINDIEDIKENTCMEYAKNKFNINERFVTPSKFYNLAKKIKKN